MTKPLYLNDTYLFESESSIVHFGTDDKGVFVIFDQTIFYPQGGGQPSDQGVFEMQDFEFGISMVRNVECEIRHYVSNNENNEKYQAKNQKIKCKIDKERRMLNARYHTAAHLLGNVVESINANIKAIKGHSFPKEAYVEFNYELTGDEIPNISQIQKSVNDVIAQKHKTTIFEINRESFEQRFYKLQYPVPSDKVFRVMRIGNFAPVPCGGTHLSSIDEIGEMTISKIKAKNNIVRISYEII